MKDGHNMFSDALLILVGIPVLILAGFYQVVFWIFNAGNWRG